MRKEMWCEREISSRKFHLMSTGQHAVYLLSFHFHFFHFFRSTFHLALSPSVESLPHTFCAPLFTSSPQNSSSQFRKLYHLVAFDFHFFVSLFSIHFSCVGIVLMLCCRRCVILSRGKEEMRKNKQQIEFQWNVTFRLRWFSFVGRIFNYNFCA